MRNAVVILGVFVADAAFRAARQPRIGETVLGSGFALGPGGKGSNQAVAAGRLGADVTLITRLGRDAFAEMAHRVWEESGVKSAVVETPESYTGAAFIFLEQATGNNGIIISPGAAALISEADIDANAALIRSAGVFVTQLEQPLGAAVRPLGIAKRAGVITILNPAPAALLPEHIFPLCDYITPNETEASEISGIEVRSLDDARRAGDVLLDKGVGTALITLGENGVLLHSRESSHHIEAVYAGPLVETTGAGDAFNGGFASALAKGLTPLEAARFACAVAGISVTRAGTAPSMPTLREVELLLASGKI